MPWTRKRAPVAAASLAASSSNTRMNSAPIALRLASGSVTPLSFSRKRGSASTATSGTLKCVAEGGDDLLALVLAHQAVVDEHAGELIADRAVHEQRRDRGVDAAGEPADHAALADLLADARDLLLDDRGRATRCARSRRRRSGSGSGSPGRRACARPRGGTGCRRCRARRPRRRPPARRSRRPAR